MKTVNLSSYTPSTDTKGADFATHSSLNGLATSRTSAESAKNSTTAYQPKSSSSPKSGQSKASTER